MQRRLTAGNRCTIRLKRSIVRSVTGVRMPIRLGLLLFLFLAVPAVNQQTSLPQQINQHIQAREDQISQIEKSPNEPDAAAALRLAVHHDAEELSVLDVSVQFDLQQLRNGILTKDLNDKLKKMEKLSRKLRREMEP